MVEALHNHRFPRWLWQIKRVRCDFLGTGRAVGLPLRGARMEVPLLIQ